MKHKTIAWIAIAMIVVFSLTVVIYPLLFNPDAKAPAAVEATPAQ